MPVLINKDTGYAENISDDAVGPALQSNTHEVPLNDPEGNPVIAPHAEAQNLIQNGYTQPNSEQLNKMLETAKYSSPLEQAKAVAEGAVSAATFGISSGLLTGKLKLPKLKALEGEEETPSVTSEEAMRARADINPVARTIGELGGLGLGMLTGSGEAKLLQMAGKGISEQGAKMLGTGALAKIGTAAAAASVENAIYQGGSEIDKMFIGDPQQTAESVMANMGMAAALGGGIGGGLKGATELWNATTGQKVAGILNSLKNRSAGIPAKLKTSANLDLAPEVEAALGDSPKAKEAAATLMESNSKSGAEFQRSMQGFKDQAGSALAESLGTNADALENLKDISKYETGKEFQSALTKSIEEKVEPISAKYDEFAEKFKTAEIQPADRLQMANDISQLIVDNGLLKGPNESALKLTQKVLNQLESQANAQDLRKYIQGLNQIAPYGSENYQIGKQLRSILSKGNEATIEHAAGANGVYEAFKGTQKEYGEFKDLLSELNDRLHLGREGKAGTETFVQALKSMDPETVVNRLELKNDVNLQNLLGKYFPEVAEQARQQELTSLLRKSLDKNGTAINPSKLFKQIDALDPQLRDYLVPKNVQDRMGSIKDLLSRIPTKMNPSGTAKTLDNLWSHIPASASAMVAMVTGHNPIIGGILGQMTHYLGREIPDATKLAMLKFMGSAEATSAEGFKAATQMAKVAIRSENNLNKAVNHVFEGSAAHIEEPSIQTVEKLKQKIDAMLENPESLMEMNNKVGHYLPDHNSAFSLATSRNLQYLANLKPNTDPLGLLDAKRVASKSEEAKYNNALKIAENPLIVLKAMREGSITPDDIKHLNALYPALVARMQSKLGQKMIEAKSEQQQLPYKTKIALSAFLMQPLDSSMQPNAIMQNQSAIVAAQGLGRQPAAKQNGDMSKLSKVADLNKTSLQNRTAQRANRH